MILIAIIIDMNGTEANTPGQFFAYSRVILDVSPKGA
jgi:hypothetical protein